MINWIKHKLGITDKQAQAQQILADSAKSLIEALSNMNVHRDKMIVAQMSAFDKKIEHVITLASKSEGITTDRIVYGYYMSRFVPIIDAMLVLVIAKNEIEAEAKRIQSMKSQGYNPSDWSLTLTNQIPISVILLKDQKVKEPIAEQPKKKVELPIDSYVTSLMYARDHFADNPNQKGVLTKVINNIINKHGRTNPS